MPDSLYDKIANALDFRALFDISPVGFALNRLSNGEFLQGNQALFDIVGYTQEEFRRLSYWDITPPKYAEQEQVALEQLKSRGEYGPYYKEYIHKNGELKPVMLRGVKTTDAHGEEYIFSIVADMTEQERARAAEANLGKIIEESLNEIYVVDVESLRFRYANKSAQANIGYSMEELLTMSPLDIIPDSDKAKILGEIKALNEGQTPNLTLQAMHQRKDKTLYDVEARVQLTNFQGKPALVASVLYITERMVAQEQANKLLKVVEHSPNSIFITDLNGRIEYANEKFEQLNGFTRADYLGKTPAIL